jgi:SAM-dependent methyltransferase
MSFKESFYPESRFGGFTDIDGTIAFYLRVASLLEPSFVVLDLGCGRGSYLDSPFPIHRQLRTFRGRVQRVIGIDVDEGAAVNPVVDEFHLLTGEAWPLDDDSVDLCVCDSVLEHVERPAPFFSEARRVLRKGGYLCIRTPNAWAYVALVSRLVPNRLHAKVLARVGESGVDEEDVFPTHYRCNSIPRLRRMLSERGFDHVVYGYESEPSYLHFSKIAYWLGVLHQRFAPRFLRLALFAFARLEK